MHPRQANLLAQAEETANKLAAKKKVTEQKQVAAVPSTFYEYTDSKGNSFYLPSKKTTIKSPYTGETITGGPTNTVKPSDFGKELKEQKEKAKAKTAADPFWKA